MQGALSQTSPSLAYRTHPTLLNPIEQNMVAGTTASTSGWAVFIAGYQDLTNEEFEEHYRPRLDEFIDTTASFLLSDEPGACLKAH